jgi:hypothetical protein
MVVDALYPLRPLDMVSLVLMQKHRRVIAVSDFRFTVSFTTFCILVSEEMFIRDFFQRIAFEIVSSKFFILFFR